MPERILAVLIDDEIAPAVMQRAAQLAADNPGSALRYVAVIDSVAVARLEFTDDRPDALVRLREEAVMLFEQARTIARRDQIEPEAAVVERVDRGLAESLATEVTEWRPTVIVIGEWPRAGLLRRWMGRSPADDLERELGPGAASVVRVHP